MDEGNGTEDWNPVDDSLNEDKLDALADELTVLYKEMCSNLRKALLHLKDYARYLEDLTDAGVFRLRENSKEEIYRFEDFLEPKSFRDTVAALQWMEHKDAVALCTYESIYRFVQPIVNTRVNINHSRTRLAKQAEAPLSRWEPTPRKENNDTGDSNENVIRPETEARYGAVYGDIQRLRDMIQQELTTVLIPTRAGVRERDCDFRKELDELVPAETLEAYNHGTTEDKEEILRDLFATAMDTDRAYLHVDTYTDDMQRIRLLSLLPSFNDLSNHEGDLNTVIDDLTALVAQTI